jgi:hypothetical protein
MNMRVTVVCVAQVKAVGKLAVLVMDREAFTRFCTFEFTHCLKVWIRKATMTPLPIVITI